MVQYSTAIRDAVTAWDGVQTAPHRFGGIEFNLVAGNRVIEIGHVHGNSMVDIPFTRKIRDILVAEGKTSEHHLLPETGWSSFYLRSEADVERAIWLLRVSYLQKLKSARSRPVELDLEREIAQLEPSDALRVALSG